MPFFQTPPELGNQYETDAVLKRFLERALPDPVREAITGELRELGELAGGPLYRRLVAEGKDEPRLVQWDAWGHRIDDIELTPLWRDLQKIAAEYGIVGAAYDDQHGQYARIHQFALTYLFEQSGAVYTCPLAMTDGAARTLVASQNAELIDRALPRLTSRDPERMWTSGQWMTERTGGSDVAISETVAKKEGDAYRLYGTKWFTSATTSEMALTLARPEGGPPGGKGLALFYLETRRSDGTLNGIQINRLKDKLGTRMVPTAELTLDGARAVPVTGLGDGIKNITPMLTVTRTWNAVGAMGGMRRGLALARDYARRRVAFGAHLADKPLHADTIARLHAEFEAAFMLTFRAVELMGRVEHNEATDVESALLRLLTPIVKLTTGKQAVSVASEVLECFGGAGYVEDTGLPRLLRDAQVLPIWEGTTNVLSLDVLRVLRRGGTLEPYRHEIARCLEGATQGHYAQAALVVRKAVDSAEQWIQEALARDLELVESGARRFAMTLGRALELALLVEHALWAASKKNDKRPTASMRFFARSPIDLIEKDDMREIAKHMARYDEEEAAAQTD